MIGWNNENFYFEKKYEYNMNKNNMCKIKESKGDSKSKKAAKYIEDSICKNTEKRSWSKLNFLQAVKSLLVVLNHVITAQPEFYQQKYN